MPPSRCLPLLLAVLASMAASASVYCDPAFRNVCLAEFSAAGAASASAARDAVIFRVALPDAAAPAPFDTLLQIVAPVSVGWAGVAWGGSMTHNPITVGWPSGTGGGGDGGGRPAAVVSSRWATGHSLPAAYAGAAYQTLSSSRNDTHWTLSVVCTGCSRWSSSSSSSSSSSASTAAAAATARLDPAGDNTLAWAFSTRAVANPASNTSAFGYHTGKGRATVDLSTARVAQDLFRRYVLYLEGGAKGYDGHPGNGETAEPSASTSVTSSSSSSSDSDSAPTSTSVSSTTPVSTASSTATLPGTGPPVSTAPATTDSPVATQVTTTVSTVHVTLHSPDTRPVSASRTDSGDDDDDAGGSEVTAAVTASNDPPAIVAPPAGRPTFGGGKKRPPFRRPPFGRPPVRGGRPRV